MSEQQKRYLRLRVITPRGQRVDQEVADVVYPAHDGLCGAMSFHAPMVNKLGQGIMRYRDLQKQEHVFYVEGGFARIGDNEVRVLARRVISPDEVVPGEAGELELKAKAMGGTKAAEIEAKQSLLRRAQCLRTLSEMK